MNRPSFIIHLLVLGALLTACVPLKPQTVYIERTSPPVEVTVLVTPTSPVTIDPAPQGSKAPIIQSVHLQYDWTEGKLAEYIFITFIDPDGDADFMHYEVISSSPSGATVRDGSIEVPSQWQMVGATVHGTWHCSSKLDVVLRTTLRDAKGNTGNSAQYTIHCP